MVIVFIIIIIVIFFVAIYRFIFGDNRTIFNFKSDVEKATESPRKQEKITGDKTLIGRNGHREIFINNNARHVFVCGTTGSGKSVALSNFIFSGINYDYPMLIVDGKGDGGSGSIMDITRKLAISSGKKLYVINLNDPKNSDKYNPFCNSSPTVIKDMLVNLTVFSEEHYKLNTERYLQRLINLLFLAEKKTSFKNIIAHIPTDKFISLSAELLKKNIITKEEHIENMEIAKASGEIAESAVARFSTLYESEVGCIFDDDGIDIFSALQEKAIILFIFNPLLLPETSPLFGNLIIIDAKKAVSHLYREHQKRVFFIFDEVAVYASPSLLDLVNKSRSARITCILATQSLSDLDAKVGEYFKEEIIENCNSYLVLRQNSARNAEAWANIIGTRFNLDLTYQVKEGDNTGLGSMKRTREYLYHPDDIKSFGTGEAIFVSKDNKFHTKLIINYFKPF